MNGKYSEGNFWSKIANFAKKAGKESIEKALYLYYAAKDPNTPKWATSTIYSALAYFIFPLDAIPDVIPVVGYTDDLGVLAVALTTVAAYITKDVKEKAQKKVSEIFD